MMKTKRLIQAFVLGVISSLCVTASAQAVQQRSQPASRTTQTQKQQQAQAAARTQQPTVVQGKKAPVAKSQSQTVAHKQGFRTTTAVKLRKHAKSNSSSIKNKRGEVVVIPKGASLKYVATSGDYYKVTYNGYTGYVAQKYTVGLNKRR